VKLPHRRTATAGGFLALSLTASALTAQQRTGDPPQRGGQPNQDTPYILVTAFASSDRKLAVEAADELRRRLQQEHNAKELFVVTKNSVNGTLEASGYRPDSALNASDLMELAKQLRGEYVTDSKATKTSGNGVRLDVRILMKTGTQTIAQPLPPADGKDLGDAVKMVERSISDALKQMPSYKLCIDALRASKWDDAAAKARLAITAYPNAAFARICLLNAYSSSKTAPPDSVIGVANQILAIDPNSLLALVNLADAYKAKGDKDKAIEMNLRIYRLDPSNQSIAQSIVQELAQSGAPDKALPIIDSLITSNPGDPGMLRTKWLLQLRIGRFKDAIKTGEELAKVDTATASLADFWNRQIGAAQSDSNNAKIVEFASKASQKLPKDISFPLLLSQTYRKMGQLQQAMEAANRATAIDPKDTRAWQLAIVTANDMNQPDSAMALAQRAIAAGADKAQIAPTMLAPINAAVKKAQASKARADWEEALKGAELVDGIAPSPETKFFIGVSAFQVAADILNEVQPLARSTKPADKAAACTGAKQAEDYLAKTSVAMPAGGRVDPNVAGQVLGAVSQYTEFVAQVKKQLCK
jgi:tetratricopeptide (TPR) repeat protein